jgi:hypothetical protein
VRKTQNPPSRSRPANGSMPRPTAYWLAQAPSAGRHYNRQESESEVRNDLLGASARQRRHRSNATRMISFHSRAWQTESLAEIFDPRRCQGSCLKALQRWTRFSLPKPIVAAPPPCHRTRNLSACRKKPLFHCQSYREDGNGVLDRNPSGISTTALPSQSDPSFPDKGDRIA